MKKFITQNLGICALSLYTLVAVSFLIFEFYMIENLPNKNHLRFHQDFYVGYHLGDPSREGLTSKKVNKKTVNTKKKRLTRSTKTKQLESNILFFPQTAVTEYLGHIGESNSLYLFGGPFFLILLPLLTFVGHRSKKTIEEKYHSKLLKYSKKLYELEKEKEDLYSYALSLKSSKQDQLNILKKIYPEQSKLSAVFNELYLCCAKEITENFKARLSEERFKSEKKRLSGKSIINDIKKALSQKILGQKINFTIKGKNIQINAEESAAYFVMYFMIKKIVKRLPKNGHIEVVISIQNSEPKIVIKDTGFSFSDEMMKKIPLLENETSQDFPEDPSFEDIRYVSTICGWTITNERKEGKFNVTEIFLGKKEEGGTYEDSIVSCKKKTHLRLVTNLP